jgi:hypothetical protein
MTVSSTTSRNQYTATSGQTVFPYTFELFDKDDVAVLQNGTLLSEGTNYTVSGVGNNSGGNITLVVGATAGDVLTIYRDMAYQRLTDYQNSGDFLAQEVNDDFDRLWLAVQQNEQGTDRAIVKPITDASSIDMTLPSAADRANSYLTFDATGAPSVVAAGDPSAPDAITRQDFTGDGSTVIYTLASAPGAAGAGVMIFIDGIQQDKDSYTITGTTLTFSEAPPLNSNINLVQLKATSIGEADSASVTYIPAGTGAVQTSVQSKLRETVSVRDFGAVGDGVTDDTAAIQAALDSGLKNIIFPAATYKINSAVNIPQTDNLTLDLMGSTIEINGGYSAFQYVDAGSTSINITSNDIVRGRNYFICNSSSDASNFSAGDLILIKTTTLWYQDDRGSTYKGELQLVERVSGSTVFIQGEMYDVYDTATDTISVQKLNSINNFCLKNGTIYNNRTSAQNGGLNLYSLINPIIDNLVIDNHSIIGLQLKQCYSGIVQNCKITRSNDAGTGYGIELSNCTNTKVYMSYFNNCRRGVDLSGIYPSHVCEVIGNTAEGSGVDTTGAVMTSNSGQSGFGSHAQSVGGVFKDNKIINCRYGFNSRGFDELIQNNLMYGRGEYFVASTFGSNLTVDGNVYFSTELEQATTGSDDSQNRLRSFFLRYMKDGMGSISITNNIADKTEQAFVTLYNSNTAGDPFDRIDISGNTAKFIAGSGISGTNEVFFVENYDTSKSFELRNCRFINNQVGRVSSTSAYLMFSTGIDININRTTSCIVEGLPLSNSTIEVYSGGGTLSSITSNLFADILNGRTHIYGYLKFTLSGGPSLTRINNLPDMVEGERFRTPIITDSTLFYGGYSGTTTAEQELRLSDNVGVISGTIPDGTYQIGVDYSFRNVVNGYY